MLLKIFFVVLFGLLMKAAVAQVGSEYYRNPTDTSLYSSALQQPRKLTVILPTTFNATKKTKYPLILIFDRQNKAIFRQLVESIMYLSRFDQIPEAVIIGIHTDNNQRLSETSLSWQRDQAKGDAFIHFVFDELIPWAQTTFNTGACRTLVGHSRFGYFTTVMMCRRADELSGVISLSPFYSESNANWVDSVLTRFSRNRPLARPLFYRFITGDSLIDTPGYARMKTSLARQTLQSNFNWDAYAYYKARHNVVPGMGIMPTLVDIFYTWSSLADSLSAYRAGSTYAHVKAKVEAAYGQPISMGLARLNGLGSGFYEQKQYETARLYWQELINDYPAFTPAYLDVADSYLAQSKRQEALTYLQQGLYSLTLPQFLPLETQQQLKQTLEQKLTRIRAAAK